MASMRTGIGGTDEAGAPPACVSGIVDALLRSDEPSVRWKIRSRVLGEGEDEPAIRLLREEIRDSLRVRRLLAGHGRHGRLETPPVYGKWQGAHWVLAALADLGYPPGDPALHPLRDQVLDCWLAEDYLREFEADHRAAANRGKGVPLVRGRYRRCASQHGNALRYLTVLGLLDDRASLLAELLLRWQWPDGGWNCDKKPEAAMSSFCETLLPMRGLAVYARDSARADVRVAAIRAAEVFLERRLVFRRSTGQLIHPEFARLHHPLYWHYDVLGGLVGMAETGMITDGRCADALDLLWGKRLPDGGWPAEKRYYWVSSVTVSGADYVDWGGTSVRRMNPWVTADALTVLRHAGRISL